MDARSCKICGKKHWGLCTSFAPELDGGVEGHAPTGCNGRVTSGSPAGTDEALTAEMQVYNVEETSTKLAEAGIKPGPSKPFDRTAYQREYMRGYRARLKETK